MFKILEDLLTTQVPIPSVLPLFLFKNPGYFLEHDNHRAPSGILTETKKIEAETVFCNLKLFVLG